MVHVCARNRLRHFDGRFRLLGRGKVGEQTMSNYDIIKTDFSLLEKLLPTATAWHQPSRLYSVHLYQ